MSRILNHRWELVYIVIVAPLLNILVAAVLNPLLIPFLVWFTVDDFYPNILYIVGAFVFAVQAVVWAIYILLLRFYVYKETKNDHS